MLRIILILLLIPVAVKATEWRVIDGDTIRHNDNVIRFWGIDAPEINQRCLKKDGSEYKCGYKSKQALELLIKDKPLVCKYINKDRYDRDIAKCFVNGSDIGSLMVSLGWAVDYKRYSKGYYQPDQFQAQQDKRGIWEGEFIEPEDFRKL